MKLHWLLVQIKPVETILLEIDSKITGDYHIMFLSRHLSDDYLFDNTAQLWHLRHEYQNNKNNVPVYSARILFDPKRKLDPYKYILLPNSFHLTDSFIISQPF